MTHITVDGENYNLAVCHAEKENDLWITCHCDCSSVVLCAEEIISIYEKTEKDSNILPLPLIFQN